MGRKLIRRLPVEKESRACTRKRLLAIVFLQHVLLWSSAYVVASTAYLIHTGAVTRELMPVAAVSVFAGSSTLIYLCLCNVTSWKTTKPPGRSFVTSPACLQTLSKNFLRFVVTAWMVASGLVITFTAARHPFCLSSSRATAKLPAINIGTQCIIQRASVAASLLAMITSICLIIILLKTPGFYLAHLSGIHKPQQLLPFTLPYKPTNRPMFSEMSFKCRSTTSFASSSYTLTDPNSDPLYNLYPTRPEKAYGLGIYAPKKSNASSSSASAFSFSTAASFLTPRPSLKTLRTHASLAGPRPLHLHSKSYPTTSSAHSPLPPVPTYNPGKYKNFPPLQHLHSYKKSSSGPPPPPRRAYTLNMRGSQETLRVVLRSPSCPLMLGDHKEDIFDEEVKVKAKAKEDSKPSNAIVNKPLARTLSLGAESISSVYSRSLSGDDPEPMTTIAPRTTIPATTTTTNRPQPRPYHQHQLPGVSNPHTATKTSSLKEIPPQNPRYRPFRPERPSSGPTPGPRPQSGARPPPIRYHQHYQQQQQQHHHQHQHQHQHQPGNNNNRILVRNHFPGPGHDPRHHRQRSRKTANAEEIRCRNSGRLPVARAVSGLGDVRDWGAGAGGGTRGVGIGETMVGSGWAARCGLPPLPVERAAARFREI